MAEREEKYRQMYIWELWLRDLGWTKSYLAQRLGVRPATVSGWGENAPTYVETYLHQSLELRAKGLELLKLVGVPDKKAGGYRSGNGLFVPFDA